ncbi:MAG: hypothetical protein HYV99_08085, partial [Betaproteobacteria bacterium]|nr:hypothetical protein [Betaproteobacteria bacterium]
MCDPRPVGFLQVRRVGYHFRLRLESHGRQRLRQARTARRDAVLRRDHRDHRRREHRRRPLRDARGARGVDAGVQPLPGSDRAAQDQRSDGLAADQGQHRRRPYHHRGEGARQHPEDRQEVQGDRRARQGREPDRPGPVVHGFIVGRGGNGDAACRGGLRRAFLPDRPGQRDRQSHPAGDQADRQPAHRAHHERARGSRRVGPAAAAEEHGPVRRRAAGSDAAHLQRAAHLRRGARTPRIRSHAAIRKRVSTLAVRVWRGTENGRFQEFEVPRLASQTVLDVVTHIQRHLDPTLAYRYACRVGMCGSCAMTVNGRARWTCRTHVDKVAGGGRVEIAPLNHLPVVRDLVTDMSPFFDKWARAHGRFRGGRTRRDDFARVPPASPGRRLADAAIECIGCGMCVSACTIVAHHPRFPGPAALNRAFTLQLDGRDVARDDR